MIRHLALFAFVAACGPSKTASLPDPPPAPVPTAPAPEGLRLPEHIAPTAYDLEVELDPGSNEFRGRVAIDLTIAEPISSLWLNGADLVVEEAHLIVGERRIELVELAAPTGAEVIGFDLGETIAAGSARLVVGYRGAVRQRTGVFRQSVGSDWYVFTDFEPTDARRAFPCFDDPRHKVPWTIALVVDAKLEAFANTRAVGVDELDDGIKRVRFAPTRPMSSYLVAFATGPFEIVDGPTEPVPIRALVPRGKAAHAQFALDAAPAMLAWLEDYFATPVPYDKIDFISVPQFSGAMENPGLITVGGRILLVDPKRGSMEQKRLLAMVIAHELAHLWFGDYVTLRWWNDLWLNEGFATWMADKVVMAWKPDWHWELEVVQNKLDAMEADASPDSIPIRADIQTLDDIRNAFGPIAYKKGGAVLAMFEAWIGEEKFRDGIRTYIEAHADGTAEAADLLDALSLAAGRDVRAPFRAFLEEPGVPVVRAKLECDKDGARVELSGAGKWQLPVCVRSSHGRACALKTKRRHAIPLTKRDCPAWVHVDAGAAGYFRYVFDQRTLARSLSASLRSLSDIEKLGLAWNLRTYLEGRGAPRYKHVYAILAALAAEDRAAIVEQVTRALERSRLALSTGASRARHAEYIRELFGDRARALGFAPGAGDTIDDAQLRPMLLELVGGPGEDTALRAKAATLAKAWLDDAGAVAAELGNTVMYLAAIDGDRAWFDAVADALENAGADTAREPLIVALGSFGTAALTKRALALGFVDKKLSHRDALGVLRVALENTHTRDVAFAYLRDHYDAIALRIPKQLEPFVPLLTANQCSEKRAKQIETLFAPAAARHAQSRRVLDVTLREVRDCAAFRTLHQKHAERFFR